MLPRPPDRQAIAFDVLAPDYDDVFPFKSGQVIATQWLLDRLPARARVLDLGCGTGHPTAAMIAEAGHELVGIDPSTGMLAVARRTVPTGRFLAMDALQVDDSLGRFDAAAAFFSLSMLSRADIPKALRRLQTVLRPDAAVAIGMVEGDLDHQPIPLLDQHVHVTAYPRQELVATATAAGLHVLEVDVEEFEPASSAIPAERHLFLYCTAPRR